MLGLSKLFIAVLAIAAIVGYGTKSFASFFSIVGVYAVLKILYNILT
jgi:hypothetical protein